MSTQRSNADWEKVEGQYRAGVMSLREIAAEHGISEGAIRKRAKRDGWERDLSAKIAERAESLVRKSEVRSEVRSGPASASDREIIEANAQAISDAVLNQRKDVQRARGVVRMLFSELETELGVLPELEQLGELMYSPDKNGMDRLNDLYRKVISLPSRVDSAKKLAESLRVLVELERKVLRIKDDTTMDDFARKVGEGAAMSSIDAYSAMCAGS